MNQTTIVIDGVQRPIPNGWELVNHGTIRRQDKIATILPDGSWGWTKAEPQEVGTPVNAGLAAVIRRSSF